MTMGYFFWEENKDRVVIANKYDKDLGGIQSSDFSYN